MLPYRETNEPNTNRRARLIVNELESRWCPAVADLVITTSDGLAQNLEGAGATITIRVTNLGPEAVSHVTVADDFPLIPISIYNWNVTVSGGATVSQSIGTGDVLFFTDLPVGGAATVSVNWFPFPRTDDTLIHTATVILAPGDTDLDFTNNTATDTTRVGLTRIPDPGSGTGVPTNYGSRLFATGSDAGAPGDVRVYDAATGQLRNSFQPFGAFLGGVRVATGDLTGDGRDDIVVGAGPGAGPHVKAYDGYDLRELANFMAFDEGFTGGVYVAAARFNVPGPGFSRQIPGHVVVGAGAGADPHVSVFRVSFGSATPDTPLASFLAYDAAFRGGVRVAAGNVDGSGGDELITGAGPGAAPHVKVFAFDGSMTMSFLAYDAGFAGGVYVATGNIDGIVGGEIITGSGFGSNSHVGVFSAGNSTPRASFTAFDGNAGEVRAAVTDRDGDGRDDLMLVAGPGASPQVWILSGLSLFPLDIFFAYDATFSGGVFIG